MEPWNAFVWAHENANYEKGRSKNGDFGVVSAFCRSAGREHESLWGNLLVAGWVDARVVLEHRRA